MSQGWAVLAPRGWHCFDTYGSGGADLLVTPGTFTMLTLPAFNRLSGPAVELSFLNGENSGRADVAALLSRLFPSERRFIADAQADGIRPGPLPRGPFTRDRTTRRGPTEVDFTTPAGSNGLGTFDSRLDHGRDAIEGAAILTHSNGADSILLLRVRLPHGSRLRASDILRAVREATATARP